MRRSSTRRAPAWLLGSSGSMTDQASSLSQNILRTILPLRSEVMSDRSTNTESVQQVDRVQTLVPAVKKVEEGLGDVALNAAVKRVHTLAESRVGAATLGR